MTDIQRETTETVVEATEEAGQDRTQAEELQPQVPQSGKENSSGADGKEPKSHGNLIMMIASIVLVLVGVVAFILLAGTLRKKEQFQGDRWYKDVDMESVSSLTEEFSKLEPFATVGETGGSSIAESWVYGNDMQIYSKGALLAMDEEYYYIANELDESRLYKISRDGSYIGEKISDIPASMVSIRDDRLYFVSSYANAANTHGIYSIRTDGTGLEYISDAIPEYLMLVNDWLYYLSTNDNHIYKMNITDRREIQLTDKDCISITIHENTIYFSYQQEGEDSKHILAAMDVDGNSYRELLQDGYYYRIMYVEGEIYYVSYDDECFCAVRPDGSQNRIVGWADLESGLQINDGKYYFTDSSQSGGLAVYEEASGNTRYYSPEHIRNFFIFDQKLYVNYLDGTEEKISVHNLADGSLIPFFG